jgi:hypothetical protein
MMSIVSSAYWGAAVTAIVAGAIGAAVAAARWPTPGACVPFLATSGACMAMLCALHVVYEGDVERTRAAAAVAAAAASVVTLGLQPAAPGGSSADALLVLLVLFPHVFAMSFWAYSLFACVVVVASALAVEAARVAGVGLCCGDVEVAALLSCAAAQLVFLRATKDMRARSDKVHKDVAERQDKNRRLLARVIPPVFIPQLARGQRVMSSRDDVCGAFCASL